MKTNIRKHNYVNSNGESRLYLHASKNGRVRIPLDIYIPARLWNPAKARIGVENQYHEDINLMLDATESKITSIKVTYKLSEKPLTLEKFEQEFLNGIPRIDFLAFFEYQLKHEKHLAPGTIDRHDAVLTKLRDFKKQIFFTELDLNLVKRFIAFLKKKGNEETTINSNLASIRKFVNLAKKQGIKMELESNDIKVGSMNGDRTDLKPEQVKKYYKYFFSEFINDRHKLVCGYFLASCFTGLRISDIQSLTRGQLTEEFFKVRNVKGKKYQSILISDKFREIINHDQRLFEKKVTDYEMNRVIKSITKVCGIKKHVTFHVGRHTFATNFLRMGGDVVTLQKLLNHSSIRETMIYVHIVEAEANEKIKLMDRMF